LHSPLLTSIILIKDIFDRWLKLHFLFKLCKMLLPLYENTRKISGFESDFSIAQITELWPNCCVDDDDMNMQPIKPCLSHTQSYSV
jgi:hypothetical protein